MDASGATAFRHRAASCVQPVEDHRCHQTMSSASVPAAGTVVVGRIVYAGRAVFGALAIYRVSNILCLLLSHLHKAWKVSPYQVIREIKASQYYLIFNLRI